MDTVSMCDKKYLVKEKPFPIIFNQELFIQINNAILYLKEANTNAAIEVLTNTIIFK